ncbi:MAG TPA: M13 family metallopeptidase [Bryobacteraceae bacterium]|nr:M13 family metallopeptidase [Bryobacteraceae bacterium]
MSFRSLLRIAAAFSVSIIPVGAQTTGIDLGAIDRAANPCNDFYQYACGTWIKNNPVPSDQSRWGRFDELQLRNRETLKTILEEAAVDKATRTPNQKLIGDAYASCMDEKGIEAKGVSSIQPVLDRIAKASGKTWLADEVARLHASGTRVLFHFGPLQDSKDSNKTIGNLSQSGLSLPDRDYYEKTDPKSVEIRAKFVAHMQRMFQLLGHDSTRAAAEAKAVMDFESALAAVSADRVTLRDPQKRYNTITLARLTEVAPAFAWDAYFKGVKISLPSFNSATPDFFKGMGALLARTSEADVKTYLTWHVLSVNASLLPAAFVQEDFQFFEATLRGVKELAPRWRRCVVQVDSGLGEALGQAYVERTFGEEGKQRTLRMVSEIEAAMAKDIQSLTWMSDTTKKQSLDKLHKVANKIGYTEKWRDYSSVRIVRGDLVGNTRRIAAFDFRRSLAHIGQAPDKAEWSMTPPTVNAYYNPAMNNINFPAGILQPPFYFKGGDEAANYGAIGAVVGHELTHGFDDSGRQYDGDGNLRDWWTEADAKQFKERADCIVQEYNGFKVAPDTNLNGKLTLGENGADNGGVRLAYMALTDAIAKLDSEGGKSMPGVGGFTPQQRFFLAYGQVWCQNISEEAARLRALTDPHSQGRYRVNGVLQNMPEFQRAFGCQVGQPMVSEKSCRVW